MQRSVCWPPLLMTAVSLAAISLTSLTAVSRGEDPSGATARVTIDRQPGRLLIRVGDRKFASYVFKDDKIPRPYFAQVKTPTGIQVTRRHPPVEGQDDTDHATMHPGIWLAFGDLDGQDFWRNKARVRHARFIKQPVGGARMGSFTEEKRYFAADGSPVCREIFRWKLHVLDSGYLMQWDSTFSADREFYFGDQEEMGLGIRLATVLAEKNGGLLRDSEGRRTARKIWSNAVRWCDYSGLIGVRRIGATLLCHPGNFRPSWMHARNYGFMAANAFGRNAMRKGDTSRVIVKPSETLRMRYGLWIYDNSKAQESDCEAAYRQYVKLAKNG